MKNTKIRIQNNKITGITVPVYFFRLKKRGVVFAECPSLGLVTYGRTLEKAKAMFADCFSLWRDCVNEDGHALEVLKDLGWKITPSKVIPHESSLDVPVHLLTSNYLNLHLQGTTYGRI